MAKKCGQTDNPDNYPTDNPGGLRDGEHQYKKKHQEVHYTNDVSVALPEPIQATGEDATKWKETYTYGAGGDRISMTYLPANDPNNGWAPSLAASGAQAGTAPKTLYYLSDALGSTLDMETQDGRVSSRYHYDEFGVPTDAKKFDTNWPGPDNLFGYTGLGYDYTSGLTYARARYYQPEIGRFISVDSYNGNLFNPQSQNGYAYVENNPLKWTDPSGYKPLEQTNETDTGLGINLSSYNHQEVLAQFAYVLEVARDQGTANNSYWDFKSILGSQFKNYGVIAGDKNNNQFKYLFGLATMTGSVEENSKVNVIWATYQLLSYLDKFLDDFDRFATQYESAVRANENAAFIAGMFMGMGGAGKGKMPSSTRPKGTVKTPPNPYGKNGGPAHQKKIQDIADNLQNQGYEVGFEKYVKTPGGNKGSRYGNIHVTDPNTGEEWIVQVGKNTKSGDPISRERKAIVDLQNAGYRVEFEPYNQ